MNSNLGGCPFGPDEVWNITWPATNASTIARQKCPGSSEAQGKTVSYRVIGYFSFYIVFFLVTANHSLSFIPCHALTFRHVSITVGIYVHRSVSINLL